MSQRFHNQILNIMGGNPAYAKAIKGLDYNTRDNAFWLCVSKDDSRNTWKLIDQKETKLNENTDIDPTVIHQYFRNIF